MQKLKELWIPAEILLNEELSDKEKIIFASVDFFITNFSINITFFHIIFKSIEINNVYNT